MEFNEHSLYNNFRAFYARQCEQICLLSVLKYFLLYRLKTNKRKWTINMIGCAFVPRVLQCLPVWHSSKNLAKIVSNIIKKDKRFRSYRRRLFEGYVEQIFLKCENVWCSK